MKNVSDNICKENPNTRVMFNKLFFFFLENRVVYEKMWKNVQRNKTQLIIQRMRIACWIPKATNTQYAVIIALPLQKWLHERASMLHYTYVACIVINLFCKALKYPCRAPNSVLMSSCAKYTVTTYNMKTKHLPLYHLSHSCITEDATKLLNCFIKFNSATAFTHCLCQADVAVLLSTDSSVTCTANIALLPTPVGLGSSSSRI
jgi:hypothetical protein